MTKGQDIGVIDAMIAAQAMSEGFTLVTHNQKHYQGIKCLPGVGKLALEDWMH